MVSSLTTANYPDLLGAITGGQRLNLDVIQCAVTTRPDRVAAGQHFEVVFLIQNASDIDIDVTIDMKLPERDKNKKKGMFYSKSARLLVGLEPAEVGYITLPASCSPKTAPGENYMLSAEIKVERVKKDERPSRVRQMDGGGAVNEDDLPDDTRNLLPELKAVSWEVMTGGKRNVLQATFQIMPPGLASLTEFSAGWTSLWKMRDHLEETAMAEHVKDDIDIFMEGLSRETLFKPLMTVTQQRFAACYPIKTIEAVYLTKLLMFTALNITPATEENPNPVWPDWYQQTLRMLFQNSTLRNHPIKLLTEKIYPVLLQDAILQGFSIITELTKEDFGTEEDLREYAQELVRDVMLGQPVEFARVYLPLVAAAAAYNERITLPKENIRDSIFALYRVLEARSYNEKTEDNDFVFDITNRLIDLATAAM